MSYVKNCDGQHESGSLEPGPRILVVDDHVISRRYSVAALRQSGVAVKAAGTPQAALRIALRWLPDAICTDLQLPGMSGYDLIRRIRQGWPGTRPWPLVVVLSADPRQLSSKPWPDPPSEPPPEPLVHRVLTKPATPAQLRGALLPRAAAGVMESRPRAAAPLELQRLFRQELALRLPGLERNLIRREFGLVRAVLHQLLASSRLCGDRRLEAALQALYTACHDDAEAAEIACRYYAMLLDAGRALGSPGTETARYAPDLPELGTPGSG